IGPALRQAIDVGAHFSQGRVELLVNGDTNQSGNGQERSTKEPPEERDLFFALERFGVADLCAMAQCLRAEDCRVGIVETEAFIVLAVSRRYHGQSSPLFADASIAENPGPLEGGKIAMRAIPCKATPAKSAANGCHGAVLSRLTPKACRALKVRMLSSEALE